MGFHGELDTTKCHSSWDLLMDLKPFKNSPWVFMGNCNEILFHFQKWGGRDHSKKLMKNFRDALADSSLNDFGLKGNQFTWINKHEDTTLTKERLDRVEPILIGPKCMLIG